MWRSALVSITALSLIAACGAAPAGGSGVVTRVSDGDTLRVDGVTIRVLGINASETHNPHLLDSAGHEIVECSGPEATTFAKGLLLNQHVTLVPDPTQADTDRYHRELRYVRLADGRDYSIEAARAGWARVYTYERKPVSEYPQLEQAQNEAMAAHAGLWGLCPDPAPGD